MKGAVKPRLSNEEWAEIKRRELRESVTGNASLVDAILLARKEIARTMATLGVNKSDRKQYHSFFRRDLILMNGHPDQQSIENLKPLVDQASEEYKTHVYTKYIRLALNREEGK